MLVLGTEITTGYSIKSEPRYLGCYLTLGLIRNTPAPIGKELDKLGAVHNCRARDKIVLIEFSALEARRTDVNLAARFGEVSHELSQRRESFFADIVGMPLLREANTFDAEEHASVLAGAKRGVGHHERDRGFVRVVLRMRETDAEFSGHNTIPFVVSSNGVVPRGAACVQSAGTRPASLAGR